ncbi:hypothetical protein [Streptomyces spirodelae]|uniref:DUF4760 domain-containing protein n=1 Tax=Streptomyces spirodelae TaxID=2812904 RepID=A0ABS3X3U8_9ACTN|nr:hypothetical protein [Streptomyces spirodelae]MBO8190048.1 hypothetical protein [Streptomyces spirodelae]
MGDNGLWIATLTGFTAVLASWVTSRGHIRAAQMQTEAAAATQDKARQEELRRTAYLAFLEQAHLMGDEYRHTPTILSMEDQQERSERLLEHRVRLREIYGAFTKSCDTVTLYGHTSAILDACNNVSTLSTTVYMTLGEIVEGTQPVAAFTRAVDDYWSAVSKFIDAVRRDI